MGMGMGTGTEKISRRKNLGSFGNMKQRTLGCISFKLICCIGILSLISCGTPKRGEQADFKRSNTIQNVVDYSKGYLGTPYKYRGTTSAGMDCSGLVQLSFMQYGIALPRTSRDMSKAGKKLKLKHVDVGDLVFFKISENKRDINHVGLVIKKTLETIDFIHSSSLKGVMISSFDNPFWKKNYVKSMRVVN
jgi:cell wall-associated NlpC family hydrolase